MSQILFRKDSVLFISKDGKEYEVSNPEDIVDTLIYDAECDIWWLRVLNSNEEPVEFTESSKIKWPGGVELIEREVPTGGSGSTSYPIFETVARLLPKEKKEPVFIPEDHPFAAASHSKVYDTESDYKPWDQHGEKCHCNACASKRNKFESSEPQEKTGPYCAVCGHPLNPATAGYRCTNINCGIPAPVESQEELWKALIDMYDLTDASSYGYATLIKKLSQHFSITRLTP